MKAGTRLGHLALLMGSCPLHALLAKLTFLTPVTRCISMDALLLPNSQVCCKASSFCRSASMLSPAWGTRSLETFLSIPKLPEQVLVPSAGIEGSHWNGSGSLELHLCI